MPAKKEQKVNTKEDIKTELLNIINTLSEKNLMRLLYSAKGLLINGE